MHVDLIHLVAATTTGCTTSGGLAIPGTNLLKSLFQGLSVVVLSLCALGLLISAAAMAIGHHANNGRMADRGRSGVIASVIGCVVAGAALALVSFAYHAGCSVH